MIPNALPSKALFKMLWDALAGHSLRRTKSTTCWTEAGRNWKHRGRRGCKCSLGSCTGQHCTCAFTWKALQFTNQESLLAIWIHMADHWPRSILMMPNCMEQYAPCLLCLAQFLSRPARHCWSDIPSFYLRIWWLFQKPQALERHWSPIIGSTWD